MSFLTSCILPDHPDDSNCPPNNGSYLFSFPLEILPTNSTYNVGDTIDISARIYNPFYDYSTEKYYNLNNFPIIFQFHISNNQYSNFDLNEAFVFIVSPTFEPSVVNSSTYGRYLELESVRFANNFYFFEFKVILLKSGSYKFSPQTILPYGEMPGKYYFEGKCYDNGINFYVDILGASAENLNIMVN